MSRLTDYTVASCLFRPPLDFILHNAGYVYVFQVFNAMQDETTKKKMMALPGIGKRSRENIEWAMEELKEKS